MFELRASLHSMLLVFMALAAMVLFSGAANSQLHLQITTRIVVCADTCLISQPHYRSLLSMVLFGR